MTIDIGTGDGRAVLARAAAEPRTLAVGLDPVAEAMAEASRRAARTNRPGGLPNALFVVAPLEQAPAELVGLASEVTIHFPWGSLLDAILGGDPSCVGALAGLLRPGGRLLLLLSLIARDRHPGFARLDPAALERAFDAFERGGLRALEVRPARASELVGSGSTWAKRLRAGSAARPAWLLLLERPKAPPTG